MFSSFFGFSCIQPIYSRAWPCFVNTLSTYQKKKKFQLPKIVGGHEIPRKTYTCADYASFSGAWGLAQVARVWIGWECGRFWVLVLVGMGKQVTYKKGKKEVSHILLYTRLFFLQISTLPGRKCPKNVGPNVLWQLQLGPISTINSLRYFTDRSIPKKIKNIQKRISDIVQSNVCYHLCSLAS